MKHADCGGELKLIRLAGHYKCEKCQLVIKIGSGFGPGYIAKQGFVSKSKPHR